MTTFQHRGHSAGDTVVRDEIIERAVHLSCFYQRSQQEDLRAEEIRCTYAHEEQSADKMREQSKPFSPSLSPSHSSILSLNNLRGLLNSRMVHCGKLCSVQWRHLQRSRSGNRHRHDSSILQYSSIRSYNGQQLIFTTPSDMKPRPCPCKIIQSIHAKRGRKKNPPQSCKQRCRPCSFPFETTVTLEPSTGPSTCSQIAHDINSSSPVNELVPRPLPATKPDTHSSPFRMLQRPISPL